MKTFGSPLRLTLYLSLLAAIALSFPASSPAADPGPPSGFNVNVVNTPLPVQGTVNVGNFPASNTVTGSVSITGTPNVSVVNTSSNPVPTQNVGGGAATQLGQVASRLVNLTCNQAANAVFDCVQMLADGSFASSSFSPPTGQALVLTDVQWDASSQLSAGTYDALILFFTAGGKPSSSVTFFSAPVDPAGGFAGQHHMATGIVVPPGATMFVSASGGSAHAFAQGYLVPNQ
jgi:hypothetical protein